MGKVEVLNPYSLDQVSELQIQDKKQAFSMLATAMRYAQHQSSWLPAYQRIEILEKLAVLAEQKKETLIHTAIQEGGKPWQDSKVEIERGIGGIKIAVRELQNFKGTEIPMGLTAATVNRFACTRRIPKGVVLAISAFNHPFNLIIHQVIPALAAGCPVIIKPALKTPLSCGHIVDMLQEAGLPENWCQMLICKSNITEELAADSGIAFLSFIGSAKVGWKLRSQLAPGTTCALEHGGAAPVIIDETADIRDGIPLLIKGGYYHAGQVCVSVQRIYVHEKIQDTFIEEFSTAVDKLQTGDPLQNTTDVGPVITPEALERIEAWVQEGIHQGGKLLKGGRKISGTCYAPTLILNPPDNCRISTEEIFGPVVCLYTYKDREEAIRRANAVPFAFQAAVFAQDIDIALDTANKLKGLTVLINDQTAFRADWMPFGGYEHSGLHAGGIGYSMRDMSHEKLMVIRSKYL